MSSTILDTFSNLIKDSNKERADAAVTLLRHLNKQNKEEEGSKEIDHALRKLIRGLGSSRVNSRKGYYSALTAHLTLFNDTDVNKVWSIMETELKTSGSNPKSENGDILCGQILTCGALIRSKIIKKCSIEEQQKILDCICTASKKRNYLSFGASAFIIEFLNVLEDKESITPIWPMFEEEICKPWSEHTLDSFYTLLVVKEKFPKFLTKKVLRRRLGNEDICNEQSMDDTLRILTEMPRRSCYKHPVYKVFCELLTTDCVKLFWTGIDKRFKKPSPSDEYLGIELLKLILENVDKSIIPSLLSSNFLNHMLKRFTFCKKYRNDDIAQAFRNLLTTLVNTVGKEEKPKLHVEVIKALIFHPGNLLISKITDTKVLQMITNNMNSEGIKKLSKLYREITANTKFKEKSESQSWTNVERTYAAQLLTRLLGHPVMTTDHEWRIQQLKFLFNLGFCENESIGIELAPQFKESFYSAIDHKLPKLNDLRNVLNSIICHIDETVFADEPSMTLRTPLNETATETWKKMIDLMKKLDKSSDSKDNINAVFHTMDLQMGLQLFSDPEMAVSSIDELHSCFDRLMSKRKVKSKDETDEPEWVEVVVDLLLSLLSRKSHLLRSLVKCVFPHMCPYLSPSSIHQILEVLDVKSGKNPLSTEAEDNSEDEDEDSDSDDEANGHVSSEEDSDADYSDVDEDETVTDRLRLALHEALGDAAMHTDDDDINVDDIGEEEGKRIDENLAAAFKILKENRQSRSKKQQKNDVTLTHFRVKVIDLLEYYLEYGPPMALALDMLVPLFALLEFCIKDPHQKPLENRVRSCLKKLSNVKKFKSVEDVDEETLTTVLKSLIEKGERSAGVCQEMGDKLAECCIFLVRCSQQTNFSGDSFFQIFKENLIAFFKKRDCVLPAVLFKSLLKMEWSSNWLLAPLLVNFAFDDSIRSFRRGQALEFLQIFYKNGRSIHISEHKEVRSEMERILCVLSINAFQTANESNVNDGGKHLKQKYICLLLTLLHTVHGCHLPQVWDWEDVAKAMVDYRSGITLAKDAKSAYNKLASRLRVPFNKPQKQEAKKVENGTESNGNVNHSDEESKEDELTKIKKIKKKSKEKQKLKKAARELRAKTMSEGLEVCDFSNVRLLNGTGEEITESSDEEVRDMDKNHKKRNFPNNSDVPTKKKKKTVQDG